MIRIVDIFKHRLHLPALLLTLSFFGCGAPVKGSDAKMDAGDDQRLSFSDVGAYLDVKIDPQKDQAVTDAASDAKLPADSAPPKPDAIAPCKIWSAGWSCKFSVFPPLLEGKCGNRKIACSDLPLPTCTCFINNAPVGAPKTSYRVGCDRVKDMVKSSFCTP